MIPLGIKFRLWALVSLLLPQIASAWTAGSQSVHFQLFLANLTRRQIPHLRQIWRPRRIGCVCTRPICSIDCRLGHPIWMLEKPS